MPENGQAVNIQYYSRIAFNALSSKNTNTIYFVEESNGKIAIYVGASQANYIDAITKGMVEEVLTGPITTHTHNQSHNQYFTSNDSSEWASLNPILKVGEPGFDTTTGILKIGNGTSTWSDLPHFSPKTLEAYSWAEISTIAEQGVASSYFKIGDEKNVTLSTGEVVTLVILGFSHDTKTAGGSAGITFGMKNLLGTTYRMNSRSTNDGGWTSSDMRSSTMATLLTQLPSDLRSYIKPVNKLTSPGNESTTINTDSDKLFLLSEIEVFGTITDSVVGEGTQYAYYRDIANTPALRVKKLSNGAGSEFSWSLRSPAYSYNTKFCSVDSNGAVAVGSSSSQIGVGFCFCI